MTKARLKVVYAGTPEFAAVGLQAILSAGHEVVLVLTQPDRPAGRGMKLQPSAVKALAVKHGVNVMQSAGLRLDGRYADEAKAAEQILRELKPDVMVVAAYGLILPQWVLDLPKWGCLNIHASLLPRWRGAAPIHRAIEAGDAQTGVSIMQMDVGLDTGDVLAMESMPIDQHDTTGSLHDKLAMLGAQMCVDVLSRLPLGNLIPQKQPEEGVCYAHKIDKAESLVDWSHSAVEIERKIRAFDPFPGVFMHVGDERLRVKVWKSQVFSGSEDQIENNAKKGSKPEVVPGQVLAVKPDSIIVNTGNGLLCLLELQRPGGKRQSAREFLQAVPINGSDILS